MSAEEEGARDMLGGGKEGPLPCCRAWKPLKKWMVVMWNVSFYRGGHKTKPQFLEQESFGPFPLGWCGVC